MVDSLSHKFVRSHSFLCGVLFLIALSFCFSSNPAYSQRSDTVVSSGSLTAEEFIESKAGQAFQAGQYEEALGQINTLLKRHPADDLLLRYKGIALDRLGKSQEAIYVFQELLTENPSHIPTRFFLAQAYARTGQADLANEEWRWIAGRGEGTPYESWAQSFLARSGQMSSLKQTAVRDVNRWHVFARYGYEYDSNVILKPNDKSLASTRDQNAGRQVMDLAVRYRAYTERDMIVDLQYSARQTIHDDSLNEFNFHSEEFQINARKRIKVAEQDVIVGARYEVLLGFLEADLFSVRNRWRLSADTRFTERSRTVIHDQMTVANFGPDGFDGSITSRDGFYNEIGLTHYIYSSDFRKYIYLRFLFNHSHTSGRNFDSIGQSERLGVHTPVFERLDFDASIGLSTRFYNNYESPSTRDASKRQDINWDTYTALTYQLTPHLGLRGFYRYISANNQNNFFDYHRQIGGAQLIYSQSF